MLEVTYPRAQVAALVRRQIIYAAQMGGHECVALVACAASGRAAWLAVARDLRRLGDGHIHLAEAAASLAHDCPIDAAVLIARQTGETMREWFARNVAGVTADELDAAVAGVADRTGVQGRAESR